MSAAAAILASIALLVDGQLIRCIVPGLTLEAEAKAKAAAWLPTFFVQQGLSITKSFGYTLVIITGSPIGCAIGAFSCDYFGRKPSLIAAGPGYDRSWRDLSLHARGKRPAHDRFPADRRDLYSGRDPVWSLHTRAVPDRGATSR
jgi:hypothetical protein